MQDDNNTFCLHSFSWLMYVPICVGPLMCTDICVGNVGRHINIRMWWTHSVFLPLMKYTVHDLFERVYSSKCIVNL